MLLQALSLLFLFPGLDVVEATDDARGVDTTTLPASETKSSSTAQLTSSFNIAAAIHREAQFQFSC